MSDTYAIHLLEQKLEKLAEEMSIILIKIKKLEALCGYFDEENNNGNKRI